MAEMIPIAESSEQWLTSHEMTVESLAEILFKFDVGGYTYPHYDKKRNGVRQSVDWIQIQRDCLAAGVDFNALSRLCVIGQLNLLDFL